MDDETVMDPVERVNELLEAIRLHDSQKTSMLAELTAERKRLIDARERLDEALELAKSGKQKRIGRPKGSRNRPKKADAIPLLEALDAG